MEVGNNLRLDFFFFKFSAAVCCSVWFPSCPKITALSTLQNEACWWIKTLKVFGSFIFEMHIVKPWPQTLNP